MGRRRGMEETRDRACAGGVGAAEVGGEEVAYLEAARGDCGERSNEAGDLSGGVGGLGRRRRMEETRDRAGAGGVGVVLGGEGVACREGLEAGWEERGEGSNEVGDLSGGAGATGRRCWREEARGRAGAGGVGVVLGGEGQIGRAHV